MVYVKLDNPYNSTIFTNCCGTAICDDEVNCPRCGQEVYPGKDSTQQQRRVYRWNWAYGRQKKGVQS